MMDQRRSLLDGDATTNPTPTRERANVFGDEFEIDDDFDGVADGFRPNVDREGASHNRQASIDGQPIRSVSAHYAANPVSPIAPHVASGPSRNSTRKSRSYANPFASPEDDEPTSPGERHHSLEFEPDSALRRSVSSASSSQFAPTSTPRFGAGPSHPYGIYPQGTMARTPSVATQSTIRPNVRQSYSQNRPAHPYAMYPQGVDDDMVDDDDDDIALHNQNPVVPVGFPGLGQNYTRRIGPDGEDQDLIGDDGHTEQLPPYSRYPEDGPEKMPLLPIALHSRAPVAGTDPGMPLMHTTLQPSPTPAPQSMTDESALERQRSRMSGVPLIQTNSNSTGTTDMTQKSWKEKTWKEKRKTRFCGIPFWWILLGVCVTTFIAAVLGGVIGGFVAGGKHAQNKNPTVTVVTSLYDASLIASPTSGAPPTGTYGLTLGAPQETQCDCLPQKNQQAAWSCDLSPNSALGIIIDQPPNGQGMGARVFDASYDQTIAYGAQLNNMNTSFAQFLTVQDNDAPANGPAFYFQQFYDKVVVVPEGAVQQDPNDNNKKRKRGWFVPGPAWSLPDAWRHKKQVANPGDKPWFCVWNGTFLEGFIYVTETYTPPGSTTTPFNSSTPAPMTSSGPPQTSANTTPVSGAPAATPTQPPYGITTTTMTFPWTTATITAPASQLDAIRSRISADARKQHEYAEESEDAVEHRKRGTTISQTDLWSTFEVFPFLFKLEERRLPNNPITPYCQQYQILDNGNANWVGDDDGNPIIIDLDEDDPSFAAYESAGIASTNSKRGVAGGCHCQWMSGEDSDDPTKRRR